MKKTAYLLTLITLTIIANSGCLSFYNKDRYFANRLLETHETPNIPRRFKAIGGEVRNILLQWDANNEYFVKGYNIYRSDKPDGVFEKVAVLDNRLDTFYLDKGTTLTDKKKYLLDDQVYFYKIAAVTYLDIESDASDLVKAKTAGKPAIPTGLKGYNNLVKKTLLAWDPSSDLNVTGYAVYRSQTKNGNFERINMLKGRLTVAYIDSGLEDMSEYYYSITAFNIAQNESKLVKPVKITTKSIPLAPQDFHVIGIQPGKIILNWSKVSRKEIIKYSIWRAEDETSRFKKIADLDNDVFEYTDQNLKHGKEYFYQIQSVGLEGLRGELSETIVGSTKPLPLPPSDIIISLSAAGVNLSWNNPNENNDSIGKYIIYKKGILSFSQYATTFTTEFSDRNVSSGKVVSYIITSVDKDGLESTKSEIISIQID